MKIYKYKLESDPGNVQDIIMVTGASILHVDLDPDNELAVWALVDDRFKGLETRKLVIVGTGREIPMPTGTSKYIGSAQQGPYMAHVFEIK